MNFYSPNSKQHEKIVNDGIVKKIDDAIAFVEAVRNESYFDGSSLFVSKSELRFIQKNLNDIKKVYFKSLKKAK